MQTVKEKIFISDELFLTKTTRELMAIFGVTKQYINKLRRDRGFEANKVKEGRPKKDISKNVLFRVKTNRMALDEASEISGCSQITIVRRLRKDKQASKPMEMPTHFDLYIPPIVQPEESKNQNNDSNILQPNPSTSNSERQD
jgi:hypothetical protein